MRVHEAADAVLFAQHFKAAQRHADQVDSFPVLQSRAGPVGLLPQPVPELDIGDAHFSAGGENRLQLWTVRIDRAAKRRQRN